MIVECIKDGLGLIKGNWYKAEQVGHESNEHFVIRSNISDHSCHIFGMEELRKSFKIIKENEGKEMLTFDNALTKIRLNNDCVYTNGTVTLKYDKELDAIVFINEYGNYHECNAIPFNKDWYETEKQKKKLLFEDAIQLYRKGYIIESVQCGTKYTQIDDEDFYYGEFTKEFIPNQEMSMEEILGEWYAYEE